MSGRYRPGERLKMTAPGIAQGLQGRADSPLGTFVRYTRDGELLVVLRDGLKRAAPYAKEFWRREIVREPVYARRRPAFEHETLAVRREGPNGFWHARDDRGHLVAVHQYRNDLLPGLEDDGFSPTLHEGDAG